MPSDKAKDTRRAAVLLPLPLAGAYDYRVPAGQAVEAGAVVHVPLGPRTLLGVVWGDGDGTLDEARLCDLGDGLAVPPLATPLRRFVDWVAAYTLAPPGAVLRMVLGPAGDLAPPPPTTAYVATGAPPPARLTGARRRV
ncbi:MAG: primosomal protein N', partial [Alphaproteobacteria bacterium]|nr:primosomal protein N' [Alphaproteobacteria bacterium]